MLRLLSVFILGLLLLGQSIHAQDATIAVTDVQFSDQVGILSVDPVPDDANRVLYVWRNNTWQMLPYPDGFDSVGIIQTYSEYGSVDGEAPHIKPLHDGSYLVYPPSENDKEKSSPWFLDPQKLTLTPFHSRCLEGVTPTNEINPYLDENYWPVIYTDTEAYLCNPITGHRSGPLPHALTWTDAWLTDDGRFLSFDRKQKDKHVFDGVKEYSYSYELATQTLRFLGDDVMPMVDNTYGLASFGPTAYAYYGRDMPEWSIDYIVAVDYTRANSTKLVMTTMRFEPNVLTDPPGLESMPTALHDGTESGPCSVEIFNALTWQTNYYGTGSLCNEGFRIPDGSGDSVYQALYPSAGIVRYNALTGVHKTIYVGDVEGLGSVSPHGRYARVMLDYTGFTDYDPDDRDAYYDLEHGEQIMRLSDGAIVGIVPSAAVWVSENHLLDDHYLYTLHNDSVEAIRFLYKQILLLSESGHIVVQAQDGTYGLYGVDEQRFTSLFRVTSDDIQVEITKTDQQTLLIKFLRPVDGNSNFLRRVWSVNLRVR